MSNICIISLFISVARMIEYNILNSGIFFLALFLGLKHAFDADHLVAVSSLLTRSKSSKRAIALSASWSVGHMVTASILTVILFTFKDSLFEPIFNNIEILVPIMLIIIGILTLAFEYNLLHFHTHEHSNEERTITREHTHLHVHKGKSEHGAMVGIGIIHGLASNDELLLLLTLTFGVNSLFEVLLGVSIFTIGVVAGMVIYSISINFSVNKFGSKRVLRIVNVSIAIISIIYAFWLISGLESVNIFEKLGLSY